jgi:apolipoprotein N-acyltransferase
VVWPETAIQARYGHVEPTIPDAEVLRIYQSRLPLHPDDRHGEIVRRILAAGRDYAAALVKQYRAPLLVCVGRVELRAERMEKHNASVLIVPGRGEVGWYGKVHLVPFGEYLPLQESAPFLKALMPYSPEDLAYFGWDAAAEVRAIHHERLHLGPLVCFEDTIPELARAHAQRETAEQPLDFLANHTNDGWFAGTREPARHLAAALFRCVECRVPMVRSTNLGETCVIDGNGRIVARVDDLSRATTLLARVPLDPRRSLYVVWGDAFARSCLGLCGVGVLAAVAAVVQRTRARLSER